MCVCVCVDINVTSIYAMRGLGEQEKSYDTPFATTEYDAHIEEYHRHFCLPPPSHRVSLD